MEFGVGGKGVKSQESRSALLGWFWSCDIFDSYDDDDDLDLEEDVDVDVGGGRLGFKKRQRM